MAWVMLVSVSVGEKVGLFFFVWLLFRVLGQKNRNVEVNEGMLLHVTFFLDNLIELFSY